MLEHVAQLEEDFKNDDRLQWEFEIINKCETWDHREKDFECVEAEGCGSSHVFLCVVDLVQAPEPRHFVAEQMPEVACEI